MPDPTVLFGMIFSLLCLLLIGGFILAFPAARRLGNVLDAWAESRRGEGSPEEIAELRREVRSLRSQLEATRDRLTTVAERQEFTERLLEQRSEAGDPAGGKN